MKLFDNPKVLRKILVSRNKLIEDLIVQIPSTELDFKKALAMRDKSFENDNTIYKELETNG